MILLSSLSMCVRLKTEAPELRMSLVSAPANTTIAAHHAVLRRMQPRSNRLSLERECLGADCFDSLIIAHCFWYIPTIKIGVKSKVNCCNIIDKKCTRYWASFLLYFSLNKIVKEMHSIMQILYSREFFLYCTSACHSMKILRMSGYYA